MKTIDIVVIGCGATGSNLIALLSQHMISCKNIKSLTLVDYDTIEEKNFKNQKFTKKDIGKNKAEVLSSRYSKLEINISYYNRKINSPDSLSSIINDVNKNNIIIVGCVDNIAARYNINESFKSYKGNLIYIDSGNGTKDRNGQVVVCKKSKDKIIKSLDDYIDLKEELKKEEEDQKKKENNFNCFNIAEHPQSFATNVLAATTLFLIIESILNIKTFKNFYQFDVEKIFINGLDM